MTEETSKLAKFPSKKDMTEDLLELQTPSGSGRSKNEKRFKRRKNSRCSGFQLFVRDRHERLGIDKTTEELDGEMEGLWKDLTDSEKTYWHMKAVDKNEEYLKLTPIDVLESRDPDSLMPNTGITARQNSYLDRFLNTSKAPVEDQIYTVVHFNRYVDISHQFYMPGEVCIVVFSISEGVHSIFETLLDPGEEAFCKYTSRVLQARETFGAPKPGFFEKRKGNVFKVNRYFKTLKEMKTGLEKRYDAEIVPWVVFALEDNVDTTIGCLNWLHKATGTTPSRPIHVLPLSSLMCKLYEYSVNDSKLVTRKDFCDKQLIEPVYDHDSRLACAWHQEEAQVETVNMCASNIALRSTFLFLIALCPTFDVEPKNFCHMIVPPSKTQGSESSEFQPFITTLAKMKIKGDH